MCITDVSLSNHVVISLVFFFQAEDGIRDYKVTGVQTCALPIYLSPKMLSQAAAGGVYDQLNCAELSGWLATCRDRKSTRLNSSHLVISYAVFCLKKKKSLRTTGAAAADSLNLCDQDRVRRRVAR